jgi:hypothetical protein
MLVAMALLLRALAAVVAVVRAGLASQLQLPLAAQAG